MTYVSLSILGGWLALDGTSVGQFMFSRPIVGATLAGWVLGDPMLGLTLGALLELLYLPVIPVGGVRFPEIGPAAVVATATARAAGAEAAAIALGCLIALVWSQVGGSSIVFLRKINMRLAPDPFMGPVSPGRLEWGHLSAIALDLLRGTAVTAVGILVGVKVVAPAGAFWPLDRNATLGLLYVAAAIPAGALLRSLGGVRRRGALCLAGAAVGLALGLIL